MESGQYGGTHVWVYGGTQLEIYDFVMGRGLLVLTMSYYFHDTDKNSP